MENTLQRYLSTLIAIFSVAIVADGQTEKFIGKGNVQVLQFSPDGEWLAIGTSAMLELYNAETYQSFHVIKANVDAIAFSPDGAELTIADKQILRRFENPTGVEMGMIAGHEYRISDLEYGPDGRRIASIDERGVVRLWEDGGEIARFRQKSSRRQDFSLRFSPDGEQLIVGAFDVEIWDIATGQLAIEFPTKSRVTSLALHPDGRQLAVGTEDGQIEFWSLQTCDQIGLADGNDVEIDALRAAMKVDSLAFGPDGTTLVVGFRDAVIAIWGMADGKWLRSWTTKTRPDEEFKGQPGIGQRFPPPGERRNWPPLLALSRDGSTVVALADRYANVGRWEADTGALIGRFENYTGYPLMLGFSADSERFATFMLWGVARVWDTATTEIIAEMQYDNRSYAAALSPNGKYVAITHEDRRITVWDVDTATVMHVLPGAAWNRGVTFSPDSRLVAAVTFSRLIRVWDVETGELIAELQERNVGSHFSVRFSPNGAWLAAAGSSEILVWETQGFTLRHVVKGLGATGGITFGALEFSPDSRWIAGYAGRPEYNIQFWNIETGEIDLELPTGIALTAGFSPDGRWFTTGIRGPDRDTYAPALQIWDTQTGQLVANLPRPYQRAIFSPDGTSVALSHDDGRIYLLPIETVLPQAAVVPVEPRALQRPAWEPQENALLQNYPNPFNPETWIPYQLATPSSVRIHIYDRVGHRVRTLALGRRPAGAYLDRARAAYWDGRDALGQQVSSGVYFYRLEGRDFSATRRMVIVK